MKRKVPVVGRFILSWGGGCKDKIFLKYGPKVDMEISNILESSILTL